jgi:cell division protein FtsB
MGGGSIAKRRAPRLGKIADVTQDRNALFSHEPLADPVRNAPTPTVDPVAAAAAPSTVTARPRGQRVVRYVLALVTSVLVIDALVGEKGLLEIIRARREHAALERSLADARATNARLRVEARQLREDPRAIEEVARRELGLIKPGEKLFIVKDLDANER